MRKLLGFALGAILFATPALAVLPWSFVSTSNKAVNGVCGASNGQSFSVAPTTGLCNAGNSTAVTGTGPWAWTCTGFHSGTTANCSASVSAAGYAAWSNYPQSASYFPTVIWWQSLSTSISGYASFLAALNGTGINTIMMLNGPSGGWWGPSSFGADSSGYLAQVAAAGVYLIPQVNSALATTGGAVVLSNTSCAPGTCAGNLSPNNTDDNSVASYQSLITSSGHTSTIIGYVIFDEPESGSCTQYPMSGIPGQIAVYTGYDSTRPFFLNSTNYVFNSGICSPTTLNTNYMAVVPVGSFDAYPLINPYDTSCCTGTPIDSIWVQGWSIHQMMSVRPAGAPFWVWVDSGSDALGFSAQNGFSCNSGTNLCTKGAVTTYMRGPPNLVNGEVWNSIINGATGIEYFCEDSTAGFAYCIGQGGSAGSLAAQANITYINGVLKTYAPMLNSTTASMCTMQTGTSYTNFVTSCTNNGMTLAMGTGNTTIPASMLVKSYNGNTYVILQPDRNTPSSTAFNVTLGAAFSGKWAQVIYDSNDKYDAAYSMTNNNIQLNSSGMFTDTFGANGDNYEVRIYLIDPTLSLVENFYAPNGSASQTGSGGCCLWTADNAFQLNGNWGTGAAPQQTNGTFATAEMSGVGGPSTGYMRLILTSAHTGAELQSMLPGGALAGYGYGYYETRMLVDPEENSSGGVCSFFLQGTGFTNSGTVAAASQGATSLVVTGSTAPQQGHPIGGNAGIAPNTHIAAVSGSGPWTVTIGPATIGTVTGGSAVSYNYGYYVGSSEIDFEFLLNEPAWIGSGSTTGAVHITTHPSGASYSQALTFQPGKSYHNYGILWTTGSVKHYIDGVLVHSTTGGDTTMPPSGNGIWMNAWTDSASWGGGPPNANISCQYDWVKFWPGVTSVPVGPNLLPQ